MESGRESWKRTEKGKWRGGAESVTWTVGRRGREVGGLKDWTEKDSRSERGIDGGREPDARETDRWRE